MIYKFDTIDVTAYGVLPLRGDGGVAVSGLFDFPKRKGEYPHLPVVGYYLQT